MFRNLGCGASNSNAARQAKSRQRQQLRVNPNGMPGDDLRRTSSARAVAKKRTLIAGEQNRPDLAEQLAT